MYTEPFGAGCCCSLSSRCHSSFPAPHLGLRSGKMPRLGDCLRDSYLRPHLIRRAEGERLSQFIMHIKTNSHFHSVGPSVYNSVAGVQHRMRHIFICHGLKLKWIVNSIFSEFQMLMGFKLQRCQCAPHNTGMETEGKENPLSGRSTEGSRQRLWRSWKNLSVSKSGACRAARPSAHRGALPAFPREETREKELKAVSRQENKNAIALILLATLI